MAVRVLVSAGIGVFVLWAAYNLRPALRLDFDGDHALPTGVVSGAQPPTTLDGQRGVWITTRIVLNLRRLDRHVAWRFVFNLRAPAGARRHVTVWADAARVAEHDVADRLVEIEHVVPAKPSRPGLVIAVFASSPSGAADQDDAFLSSVTATPEGFAYPPLGALLSCVIACACLALWLAWLDVPRAAWLAAVLAFATMNAVALVHGLAAYTAVPTILLVTDLACLVLVWALRALETRGTHLVAAGVISAVALHVQLLVLLHPSVTHGDTQFHVHRLQVVESGQLFFLSNGPGGEFPYPPALYVLTLLLQRAAALATDDALRLTLAISTAAAGLVMYAVAATSWNGRRALFGLALYHAFPIALGIQVFAFMTNAFGNVLAAAALALAGWSRARRSWPWIPAALGTVLATGAMLAHVSSALILAGALVVIALLCLRAGDRPGALAMSAVLVVSAAIAWTTYYSHPSFLPVYRQYASAAQRAPAGAPAASAPRLTEPAPVMRAEAHQTRWVPGWPAFASRAAAVPGYVRRYYGLAGTALAWLGVLLLAPIAGSRLDRVVAGTLAACAVFLCLGVATPVDLRYYAAAYPFLAFAGGLGADRCPARGSWVPQALLAAAILAAGFEWYRWLHTPDL